MTVFINGKEVSLFYGATLQDAVRAYSMVSSKRLISGYLAIFDRYGYLTEPDGPARDGGEYFLRLARKKESGRHSGID